MNRKPAPDALPELPLPTLQETLRRTLQWLRPLADDKTLAQTELAISRFAGGTGPVLQGMLHMAEAPDKPIRWHEDMLREQRLREHRSLPLSGNVALAIDWQAPQRGLKRVAHFVNALLHVHRDYLAGNIPATPGLCTAQWDILRGASRRPHIPRDKYLFAGADARGHIMVVHGGRGWKLEVFDDKKRIAHPAQIEKALDSIIAAGDGGVVMPFGAPSVLPAQQALEIRAQLISRDDNRRIWQSLEEALFVLTLNGERHNDSTDGLYDALFSGAAEMWAYKPLNYCCHYRDDRFYLHSESAWVDAGVLQEILRLAQRYQQQGQYACKNALPAQLEMEMLEWTVEQNTGELLAEALVQYQQQAERMALSAVDIFITDDERRTLAGLPGDALLQLLLQYAQGEVYGRIRSMRNAVDMRHFRHGRLDVMRPLTAQSLAAARAMHDGVLTRDLVEASMTAHMDRLSQCLAGQGIGYHLLALQEANRHISEPSTFFRDEGLALLQEDFFATDSLGAYDAVASLAFAPRHPQGMSIHYAFNRNNINIMITHRRADVLAVKALGKALRAGVRQVIAAMQA